MDQPGKIVFCFGTKRLRHLRRVNKGKTRRNPLYPAFTEGIPNLSQKAIAVENLLNLGPEDIFGTSFLRFVGDNYHVKSIASG